MINAPLEIRAAGLITLSLIILYLNIVCEFGSFVITKPAALHHVCKYFEGIYQW